MMRLSSVKSVTVSMNEAGRAVIEAEGEAPSAGWEDFQLWPWHYLNSPEDGVLDLDLVGKPSAGGAADMMSPAKVGPVELPVPVKDAWGAGRPLTGVRVHGERGAAVAMIDGSMQVSGGDAVPWPWRTVGGDLVPWPW